FRLDRLDLHFRLLSLLLRFLDGVEGNAKRQGRLGGGDRLRTERYGSAAAGSFQILARDDLVALPLCLVAFLAKNQDLLTLTLGQIDQGPVIALDGDADGLSGNDASRLA